MFATLVQRNPFRIVPATFFGCISAPRALPHLFNLPPFSLVILLAHLCSSTWWLPVSTGRLTDPPDDDITMVTERRRKSRFRLPVDEEEESNDARVGRGRGAPRGIDGAH